MAGRLKVTGASGARAPTGGLMAAEDLCMKPMGTPPWP